MPAIALLAIMGQFSTIIILAVIGVRNVHTVHNIQFRQSSPFAPVARVIIRQMIPSSKMEPSAPSGPSYLSSS